MAAGNAWSSTASGHALKFEGHNDAECFQLFELVKWVQ